LQLLKIKESHSIISSEKEQQNSDFSKEKALLVAQIQDLIAEKDSNIILCNSLEILKGRKKLSISSVKRPKRKELKARKRSAIYPQNWPNLKTI